VQRSVGLTPEPGEDSFTQRLHALRAFCVCAFTCPCVGLVERWWRGAGEWRRRGGILHTAPVQSAVSRHGFFTPPNAIHGLNTLPVATATAPHTAHTYTRAGQCGPKHVLPRAHFRALGIWNSTILPSYQHVVCPPSPHTVAHIHCLHACCSPYHPSLSHLGTCDGQ